MIVERNTDEGFDVKLIHLTLGSCFEYRFGKAKTVSVGMRTGNQTGTERGSSWGVDLRTGAILNGDAIGLVRPVDMKAVPA